MLQSVLLAVVLAMISLSSGPAIMKAVLLLLALIVLIAGTVSRQE